MLLQSGRFILHYLSLPGTSSNFASTVDSAALSVTGDIELSALLSTTDWTPTARKVIVSKWTPTGSQQSYEFNIETSGKLRLLTSPDGSGIVSAVSTVAPTVVDGAKLGVKATRASADGTVTFYTSTDDGVTWVQLGDPVDTTDGGIFNSTSRVDIGQRCDDTLQLPGSVYFIQIRNGIGGTLVGNADFRDVRPGTSPVVDSTGASWGINGTAVVV